MILYLNEWIQKTGHQELKLTDRLPVYIENPSYLEVDYRVEEKNNFYLLLNHARGTLKIQCQRCLEYFQYQYDNHTEIAVCQTDSKAEELLEQYESVVAEQYRVNLNDILIDDLHLYIPSNHLSVEDCNQEINDFLITKKNLN